MIDEDQIKAANRVLAAARAWHAWSPEKDGDDALGKVESDLAEAVEAYESINEQKQETVARPCLLGWNSVQFAQGNDGQYQGTFFIPGTKERWRCRISDCRPDPLPWESMRRFATTHK